VRALLAPLRWAGWLRHVDARTVGMPGPDAGELDPGARLALTPRGFDCFHDLERWVTYELIEPLWAQMLAEHAAEGAAARWVNPGSGRRGRLWKVAERVLERPVGT
jgi:hypothetical protein